MVEFIKFFADEGLTRIGYHCFKPDGAFYMFVKALEDDSNAFCEKAKEDDREMIKRSMPAFEKIYKKYNK